MKRLACVVAGLVLSLRSVITPLPLLGQSEADCSHPANASVAPTAFAGFNLLTGASISYNTSSHRCDNLTEKGPRALNLYKHCPNFACQAGFAYGGVGIITALESNLKSKLKSCLPSNCDTWFGLVATTGLTKVANDRTHLEGWHRLGINLFGAVLPLPVQRFQVDRMLGPIALQQQFGVPFYTSRWSWSQRDANASTPPIDIEPVGRLVVSLKNLDNSPVRTWGTGELNPPIAAGNNFYIEMQPTSLGDWTDWDWYISPSVFWKSFRLASKWTIDFEMTPYASVVDFTIGKASLSAFVRGDGTANYNHAEGKEWGTPYRNPPVLPENVYMRHGAITEYDTEGVSAGLTGGIRLRVTAGWFSWSEEWALPGLNGSGQERFSPKRDAAAMEVLWTSPKMAGQYTLTPCGSTPPPPAIPRWVTESLASPPSTPDPEEEGDITTFARTVGRTVTDSFVICPTATPTSADARALEQIRQTYLRERQINQQVARQNACAALTTKFRQLLAVCKRGIRKEPVPATGYTRGRIDCQVLI